MSTCLYEIQKGIYTKLTADATLVAAVTGIYDDPPENTDYPYVLIGDSDETRDDTFTKYGRRARATVEVWSDYHGAKESLDLVTRITDDLDGVALTLTGWTHIRTLHESTVVQRMDGIVRRATVTLTVLVTKA